MTPAQTNIAIGMLRDFAVVGAGGILTAFSATTDLATNTTAWPGWRAVTIALLTALLAAIARAQSKVEKPVIERGTRIRTPEQLAQAIRDREAVIATAVDLALKARGITTETVVKPVETVVTPLRIPVPTNSVAAPAPVVPPVAVTGPGTSRIPREWELPQGGP
jgi:hypothetical protein